MAGGPEQSGISRSRRDAGRLRSACGQAPKVWETYLEAAAVFDGPLQGEWRAKRPGAKSLRRTSKFGDLDLSAIVQAGSGNHWLTSQRGELTYYEIMMNRDEYEFITTQKKTTGLDIDLTTAAGQLRCVEQAGKPPPPGEAEAQAAPKPPPPMRGGLNMPAGSGIGWRDTDCAGNVIEYGDKVGAMEIKAAWTPLPADHSLDNRYLTATAEIQDPVTNSRRVVTVGLVGLHIVRKRPQQLAWIWSTFEHIDNSPDENPDVRGSYSPPQLPPNPNQVKLAGYTFFNTNCIPANDKVYGCAHNSPPTTPCLLGSTQCQPYNAPMQITRINRVGSIANSVTAYAWSLMPKNSVFNYYRLINVQYPTKGFPTPLPGQRLPLPMGDPSPQGAVGGPKQIVSNTTLESFQQTSASCMDCHANYAQIYYKTLKASGGGRLRKVSKPAAGAVEGLFASDYSFIFATETKR